MNIPAEVFEAINAPDEYARRIRREKDRKIVGCMCSYTPEEIIWAGGAMPLRLFGTKGSINLADAHLQAYCCSLVRGVLEDALSGKLDYLDGAVFPHTCDTIQRLSDIWRLNVPFGFHADVVLPVKLDRPSSKKYMLDVLAVFRSDMEKMLGSTITDERISEAIALYNRIRGSLKKIYEMRYTDPGSITAKEVYALTRASMIMDRERIAGILSDIAAGLVPAEKTADARKGKRLILAGGLCNMPDVHQIIEEAGGEVIWDDLCTGSRYFEGLVSAAGNPLEAMADRYMERPVCPAKHQGTTSRADNLERLIRERQAEGVVFMLLKFCDPHAFDYPHLKQRLDDLAVPSVLIEIDEQLPAEGPLKTRIEAFLEMI